MLLRIAVTALLALGGGMLFLRKKVPAGAFIGPIVFVGLVQLLTGELYLPQELKTVGSVLTGSYLGTRVRRQDLIALKKAPVAAVLMIVSMLSYNVISGLAISTFTQVDFGSALLGTAPGGSSEFALVAADMGYNSAAVSIMQILRIALIVPLIPLSNRYIFSHFGNKIRREGHEEEMEAHPPRHKSKAGFLAALAIGIPAGLFGKHLGVPAGTICLSMFAVGVVNIITDKMYFPMPVRYFANTCNGAVIGARLAMHDIALVGAALPVILLVDLGWVVLTGILGLVIYRFSAFSLVTSLFAGAPGGMSDMTVIAEDMGGNATQVTVMQLCRLVCVMFFTPFFLHHMDE